MPHDDERQPLALDGNDGHSMPRSFQGEHALRRRRSSVVDTLRSAGGPNSFDNFARSWQRAAGFYEITPVRPSYRLSDSAGGEDEEEEASYGRTSVEGPSTGHSLLRAALQNESQHRRVSEDPFDDDNGARSGSTGPAPMDDAVSARLSERRWLRNESIISIEPSLSSAFAGSFGTSYGSMGSNVNETSMRHAGRLFTEQQTGGANAPDKEREPLLVKQVEQDDGKVVNVVVGQSTLPQTVFNSSNVLIGVGLLSLPLALRYAGWVIGIVFFVYSALVTNYTAKLLAKCLDVDNALITFADLAYVAFGNRARIATSILFTLELLGACVALVVLFADSLDALIPGLDVLSWKIICGILLVPLAFVPLRLLSFTSILGILCCAGITISLFIDGLIKPDQPGSLREPAKTYLFPQNWGTVPLSLGLIMSPWGGHSVFPNIYRDMRHPSKYSKGVNITYAGSFLLDLAVAIVGILMFGDGVLDEVTSNIFLTEGYPRALSVFMAICIAIIPLTKIPLNARPIISTIEVVLGLDSRAIAANSGLVGMSGFQRGLLKFIVRVVCQFVFVIIAIALPSFDRIMTLLGAIACFSICIIIPLAVHLKLFGSQISKAEKIMNWVLMIVSIIAALISTVFAVLPKEMVGAA